MIETNRLKIFKSSISDVDLLLKMDRQSVTQEFLGGVKNKTREERIEFLKNKVDSYTVMLKDGTRIGFIGIKDKYLSYIFDEDYTHNGYCYESCRSLINSYFKNNNDNIYAEVNKNNMKSIKVLNKLRFKYLKSNDDFDIYVLEKQYFS